MLWQNSLHGVFSLMAVGFILGSSPKCKSINTAIFPLAFIEVLLILFSTHATNLIIIDAVLASWIWEVRLNKSSWMLLFLQQFLMKKLEKTKKKNT